jgi:hypothetical protein
MPGTHKQCPSGPLRAPPEHGGPPSKQLGDNPLSRTSGGPWPRRRSHRPDKRSSRHRRQRGSWPAACGGSRWPVVPAVRLVLERARPSPLGPVYDLRWQFSLPSYLVFIVVAVVAGTATGLYAGQGSSTRRGQALISDAPTVVKGSISFPKWRSGGTDSWSRELSDAAKRPCVRRPVR